jgi:flagellar biosynthesis GTPase FlhF
VNLEIYTLVIGTFLGAFFSSIGYLLKRRTERKKILNQSLFSLLEIWLQINKIVNIDPAEVVKQIKEYINKKSPGSNINEKDQASIIMVIKIVKDIIVEKEISKKNESLETLFYNTIKEISSYSPVLAFELNKDHSIKHILSLIDEYIKSAFANIEQKQPEDLNNIKQFIKDKIQEKLMRETLNSLESDLKKVAWKSSILNYYKVKRLVKDKKKFIIDEKFLDKYLSEFFNSI